MNYVIYTMIIHYLQKILQSLLIRCQIIVKKTAGKYGIKVGDGKKLVPNLGKKTNYVVHYKNLQLYLSFEMKLNKIHKTFKFKQSDWLKKYINFNTEKKNATTSFGKDFFKLVINSLYGKTMENLRKRINVTVSLTYEIKSKDVYEEFLNRNTCLI